MFPTWRPEILLNEDGAILSALVVGSVLKHVWMACAHASRDRMFTLVGHVAELNIFPIKGCGRASVQSATVTDEGMYSNGFYDRRWAIQSKETGNRVIMKEVPRLTHVAATVDGDWLTISAPDMTPLRVPRHPNPAKFQHVKMNEYDMPALDMGPEASEWMTKYVRQPVRLLHSGPGIGMRDSYDIPLAWETSARKGDKVVFAFLAPYLLCTTASLADLNGRLDTPVDCRNFRPNIVVHNTIAFDEDDWEEVRIGSTSKFHYIQPCRRCVIVTVNPDTAKYNSGGQPLTALRKYRQKAPYGDAPLFGAYLAMDCQGEIKVGDPVYAIRRAKSTAS